jgi:hypothetical protein
VKVVSCWQLGDVYASVTITAPEGSDAISITAAVGPGEHGGWVVEWWHTTPSFQDVEKIERVYRRREAATMRAIHGLLERTRELSMPVLARAS